MNLDSFIMIRVKAKNLKAYEEVSGRWKLSFQQFPQLLAVVKLFKASGKFEILIDKKDHQFLKGDLMAARKALGLIFYLTGKN